jgi:DNA-binding LacI/PurR family transcriptional regulator
MSILNSVQFEHFGPVRFEQINWEHLDGLLVFEVFHTQSLKSLASNSPKPVVVIDYDAFSDYGLDSVVIDQYAVGRMCAEYMRNSGITRAGFLGELEEGNVPRDPAYADRLEGFRSGEVPELEILPDFVIHNPRDNRRNINVEGVEDLIRKLQEYPPEKQPQALFLGDIVFAGLLTNVAQNQGLTSDDLPELWTINFEKSDTDIFPINIIPCIDDVRLGEESVNLLLKRIRAKDKKPELVRVPPLPDWLAAPQLLDHYKA